MQCPQHLDARHPVSIDSLELAIDSQPEPCDPLGGVKAPPADEQRRTAPDGETGW